MRPRQRPWRSSDKWGRSHRRVDRAVQLATVPHGCHDGTLLGLCRDLAGTLLEMVFVGENRGPLGPFTPSHLFLFAAAPSTPSFPSWMRLFPPPSGSASPDAPPAVAGKCSRPSDAIGVAEKGRMAGTETSDSYLEITNMMEGTRPSLELDATRASFALDSSFVPQACNPTSQARQLHNSSQEKDL